MAVQILNAQGDVIREINLNSDHRSFAANLPEGKREKFTLGAAEAACDETYEDLEADGGVWSFSGWTTEPIFDENGSLLEEVKLVGTWTFEASEPEPVDPIPEETVVPEEPEVPVIHGEPGDTDETDAADDGTTIDETAVPLASGPVTRAEFMDYLWRHEGQPAPVADSGLFEDVTEEHTYSPAMAWAKSIGIIESCEDGTFEPDELVTVSAARGILTRYAAYLGIEMPEFTALVGEDDEPVLNCDEVISEFFGE